MYVIYRLFSNLYKKLVNLDILHNKFYYKYILKLKLKKLKKILFSLILLLNFFAQSIYSQENSSMIDHTSKLLKDVNLRTFNGREMADVSLKLVLKLVIDHSLTLKASKLGKTLAKHALVAAEERNAPSVTSSFGYSSTPSLSASSTCSPNELCGSNSDITSFSSSYSLKSDTGITYGLTYSEQNTKSTTLSVSEMGGVVSKGSTGDPLSKASLTGSVSIPFFQDWGTEYNKIPELLAEIGVNRSNLNYDQTELSLLKQVSSIYWDLVGILETVEVKKKAVKLSEKLLKDTKARFKVGLINAIEVKASENQLMRNRHSLLSANLDAIRIEDQVRAALNIKNLPVGLYPVDRPDNKMKISDDILEVQKKMYENDSQIRLKKVSLEQNRYQLEQELNKKKTNLDLNLSYILNGYSKNFFGSTSDFGKSELHGLNATFTWKLPLGDQAILENIQRKRIEQQQLIMQIEDRKTQLDLNLQSQLRSLDLIEKEKLNAAAVSKLSMDQLQNEIKRFKFGKSTSYQISKLQQDVEEAEQQEILIRIRREKIRLELLTLTGEFKEKYELD